MPALREHNLLREVDQKIMEGGTKCVVMPGIMRSCWESRRIQNAKSGEGFRVAFELDLEGWGNFPIRNTR